MFLSYCPQFAPPDDLVDIEWEPAPSKVQEHELPLSIVYTHLWDLRAAMRQPGFTTNDFLEEARRKDAAEQAAAQRRSEATRREDRMTAVIAGAALFGLPVAGVYARYVDNSSDSDDACCWMSPWLLGSPWSPSVPQRDMAVATGLL